MTKEEAIEVLQKNYPDRCYSMLREAVDIAIEALRNEINCVKCAHYTERETYTGIKSVCKMDTAHMEDLISRREALAGFPEYKNDLGLWTYNTTARAYIKSLPSVDRPQGEWKPKNHHTDYCSNCGFEEMQWRTVDYNFCPSCGKRMKGVNDEHTV